MGRVEAQGDVTEVSRQDEGQYQGEGGAQGGGEEAGRVRKGAGRAPTNPPILAFSSFQ